MKQRIDRSFQIAFSSAVAALPLAAVAAGGEAATPTPTLRFEKPAWLTDLSLGVRETYDNNLLLVSGHGPMHRADSWLTTVSPKVGVNFLPLLPDQGFLQALTFSYAPDFATYHDEPVEPLDSHESYNLHRLANTIKGHAGDVSFNLENGFNYVDGSKVAPTYTGTDSQRSAYATAVPRERRNQYQDRAKATVQYDQDQWFARLTSALTYYELLTQKSTAAGYQNYADRYDVNGGGDFGYKLQEQLAATVGYRYGQQYQETFSRAIDAKQVSANSDYQRVLLGLEGKPWQRLTVALQGGPDFRSYEGDEKRGATIVHSMPVNNQRPITYYGEALISADLTANDALTFKYKQWEWVSSTGKVPYFESSYELTYRRKLTKQLGLEAGGRLGSSDYTSAYTKDGVSGTSWERNDWMLTAIAGLTYTFSPNFSANLGYSYDWGRNEQDNLPAGQIPGNRNFERQLVALGAQVKF